MSTHTLTNVPDFKVGHVTNLDAATGCTVVICPPNTVGGVDVRGGAPGTRETDLLNPHNHVSQVNAVVLSGGSAFGLATADGVVRYLAEQSIGYKSGAGFIVPIVPAAILFDLHLGDSTIRPDAQMGYSAAQNASTDAVLQGTVGAGTGAICGAMRGTAFATKGGLGSASIEIVDGLWVAALVAVNSVGDVLDEQGQILAGLRDESGQFVGMLNALRALTNDQNASTTTGENTVIGVVATNAHLTKAQVNKVAQMAHDGIARAINPAHTMFDGDTIFALASGKIPADPTLIGSFAAEAMTKAIRNGIRHATTLYDARAIG
ncbi:MAG: P1 family peptidase [Anaerolineae bacterium]